MSNPSKRTKFINQVERLINSYQFLKPRVSRLDDRTHILIQTKSNLYSIYFYYDDRIIKMDDFDGIDFETTNLTFRKLRTVLDSLKEEE